MTARLTALLALALFAGCSESESAREERAMKDAVPNRLQLNGTIKLSDADRAALDLAVVPATEGELPDVTLRFGRVRAVVGGEALVVSPVTGRIPRPPLVALGGWVNIGASLLDVVPVLAAAERISVNVQGAEMGGQIAAAENELATQQSALERARDLARSNIVSQAKLQEAETAVATTRARLDALRLAKGVQARGEGAPITLRAPSAGAVVTLNASVGSVVQQGDLLVRLLRPGPRWIDVSLAPTEPAGERYEVNLFGRWAAARLLAVGAVAEDDGTRNDRLEVSGADALRLIPGQTVTVRVAGRVERGIVLPESAIVPGVPSDLVFVDIGGGAYLPRAVKVGARLGGQVRITAGLRPGERIVARGAMALAGETRRTELRHLE